MLFRDLARVFQDLESTTKRLEMTSILADLFRRADKREASMIAYLLQGMIAPAFKGLDIGVGEKFVQQAIAKATGYPVRVVEEKYYSSGDLGLVAEELVSGKKQKSLMSRALSVSDVFNAFDKMARASGAKSQAAKISQLVELLNNASPLEARYLVRIPLGKLRLGVGDPTVLDALATVFAGDKKKRNILERAYNLTSDIGLVTRIVYEQGLSALEKVKITPGTPLRPALCERLPSAKEIIEKLGQCAAEAKYDGVRLQVHLSKGKVWLFSRRQENMTSMFPDIVKEIKKIPVDSIIFDSEALSYNEETGEFYPFQKTVQRKRKYGVKAYSEEFPLRLFVFDVMHINGKDVIEEPYTKRRAILEKEIEGKYEKIKVSEKKLVKTAEELQNVFDDYVSRGLEGVVAKDLKAPYTVGARKFAWVKLKRSYKGELSDSIDAVILGYFKGKGHRARFKFGTLLAGVYDSRTDSFKTIAKVGSGFTEDQMKKLGNELEKIRVNKKSARVDSFIEPDVWLEPKYVVTLVADEITESPVHTCGWNKRKGRGYALRFPRIVSGVRDKKPEDATTVEEIKEMFQAQKRVKEE